MIEDRALQLLDLSGYIDAWWVYIQTGYTRKKAFDLVEEEFMRYFGRYRYVSYESFYQTMWAKMKRHYENKTNRLQKP